MRCARCNEEYQGQHTCRALAVGDVATVTLTPAAQAAAKVMDDDDAEISVERHYPKPVDDRLAPGTMVGEYRIEQMIGKGGMGQVYSGTHPVIGKRVAIKVLDGQFARDKETLERFITEARAVNRIGHPNIVDIFAFGQLPDGRPYFCMEFLPGMSLRERMRKGNPLTFDETIAIFLQITSPLAAAHEVGIVHRDLKPDNIQIVESKNNRQVKLLDFGVAKLLDTGEKGAQNTSTGLTLGTPTYMSPEQCLCKPVDARSDIYALGVILFVVCTGTRPFTGQAEFQVLEGHVHRPPPRPSSLAPIPERLELLILKCLEKDPAARPQSASEVAAELEAIREEMDPETRAMFVRAGQNDDTNTPVAQSGLPSGSSKSRALPGAKKKGGAKWPIAAAAVGVLALGGVFVAMQKKEVTAGEPVSEAVVQVISDPPGATVKIAGKAQALMTPSLFKVPRAPELPVVIELEGYEPYAETVRLGDKENEKALKVKLKPLKATVGNVIAKSPVAKAQWTLDGSPVGDGSGTLKLTKIPVGEHLLAFEAEGYEGIEKKIDVKGDDNPIELSFIKSKKKKSSSGSSHASSKSGGTKGSGEANDITGWPPK